eukprot:TRINITY_DN64047_c0_g1_i1.p1 TRINITY_DN64047_c0_g1~~TRINITY_DN64047_c0_g1_i1.p1  ORF type:complete len:193 (-),score=15.13 TRINITY_DN64047_c0_g1_i1:226-804(-)
MMKAFASVVAVSIVATLSGCGGSGPTTATTTTQPTPTTSRNIVEELAAHEQWAQFSAFLAQQGLNTALSGPGPFTVFAPMDVDFLESLDGDQLTNALQYHVVHDYITESNLSESWNIFETLFRGHTIRILLEENRTMFDIFGETFTEVRGEKLWTGLASLSPSINNACSNGVIYWALNAFRPNLTASDYLLA